MRFRGCGLGILSNFFFFNLNVYFRATLGIFLEFSDQGAKGNQWERAATFVSRETCNCLLPPEHTRISSRKVSWFQIPSFIFQD